MKILHVIPSYKPAYIYAGVIESVSRLCEGLAEAGHIVHVFTTTANGKTELEVPPGKELDVDGVKVKYFKRITKDPTHVSPALWRHLLSHCNEYDVIHIHTWWNFLVVIAAWICHLKHKRIIISPRGMLSQYIFTSTNVKSKKWLHRILGRKALLKSVFHATAQSEYEECTQLISGWKGFLLPNILMLPECEIHREHNATFTMIFLSRIHPKKGLELLLAAMKDLPFDVRLKIAGSGEEDYINALKKDICNLGLCKQVEWLGWKDRREKFQELMKSDVFVLTSYNENFANVVIEALHVGTPVLISEQVGLAPFVNENGLGWVTALNVQSIRSAIIDAYGDQAKRAMVNEHGRQIIDRYFSQAMLISQYVTNYDAMSMN
ncbi:MAG: glycosyltransferase [Chryseosolibacter sp.]